MPRTALWLSKIGEIRERVEASKDIVLDRADIATLFGVSQRQAAHILETVGWIRKGGALLVPRSRLVGYLNGQEAEAPAQEELERRRAVRQTLAEVRAAGPRLRAVERPKSSQLPAGVRLLGAGRLEVTYNSPEDLLGVILAIADFADRSPSEFEDSLEYLPPDHEEEDE